MMALKKNISSSEKKAVQETAESVILSLIILAVYLFTVNPATRQIALPVILACLGVVAALYIFGNRLFKVEQNKVHKMLAFAFVSALLLWIGNMGWLLSPFFYVLYLVAISLTFLFSASVAFSFVIVLVAVLLPSINVVNAKIDVAGLLALLLLVPLSYFLRIFYLEKIEKEKKIADLEKTIRELAKNLQNPKT